MICTIYPADDGGVFIGSSDSRFKDTYGIIHCSKSIMFTNMSEITFWVNNELHEAMYFEVED